MIQKHRKVYHCYKAKAVGEGLFVIQKPVLATKISTRAFSFSLQFHLCLIELLFWA